MSVIADPYTATEIMTVVAARALSDPQALVGAASDLRSGALPEGGPSR